MFISQIYGELGDGLLFYPHKMVWFIRLSTGTCHFCSFVGTWTHLFWIFSFGAVVFRFFIRTFCFSWPSATFLHGVSSPWIDQLTGGHYSKWLNETGLVEAFAFDGTHQVQHLPGFDRCPIMSPRGWWKIWGITHEIRNVNAVLEKKLGEHDSPDVGMRIPRDLSKSLTSGRTWKLKLHDYLPPAATT